MNKKWTLATLITTLVLLIIIIATTIVIDPFFHYHAPISKNGYGITSALYQNSGIAKNFDYDAVILGSSMVQNTKASELDDLFDVSTVKLCYPGAYTKNFKVIMDIATEEHEIEKVFWGLDIYSFLNAPDHTRSPLPEYLYDDNAINDIKYVLNKGVFGSNFKVLKGIKNTEPSTNFDDAYEWYSANVNNFKPEVAINKYLSIRPKEIRNIASFDKFESVVSKNMDQNILPLIKDNQNIEFYIFFPPYSIFFWDNAFRHGELDAYLYIEQYIIETLLQYDNVKMFYFQNDEEIVCNIENYKDYTHYSPNINSFITQNLITQDYLITQENYLDQLDKTRELILNTDVDALINSYLSTDD